MNSASLLIAASGLTFIVAAIHSFMGEILIFSRMRRGTIIPICGGDLLRERHVRILWASWHIVSIFGVAFAAILLRLAYWPLAPLGAITLLFIAGSTAISGILVLCATRARHPGWIGLLAICALIILAISRLNPIS